MEKSMSLIPIAHTWAPISLWEGELWATVWSAHSMAGNSEEATDNVQRFHTPKKVCLFVCLFIFICLFVYLFVRLFYMHSIFFNHTETSPPCDLINTMRKGVFCYCTSYRPFLRFILL